MAQDGPLGRQSTRRLDAPSLLHAPPPEEIRRSTAAQVGAPAEHVVEHLVPLAERVDEGPPRHEELGALVPMADRGDRNYRAGDLPRADRGESGIVDLDIHRRPVDAVSAASNEAIAKSAQNGCSNWEVPLVRAGTRYARRSGPEGSRPGRDLTVPQVVDDAHEVVAGDARVHHVRLEAGVGARGGSYPRATTAAAASETPGDA